MVWVKLGVATIAMKLTPAIGAVEHWPCVALGESVCMADKDFPDEASVFRLPKQIRTKEDVLEWGSWLANAIMEDELPPEKIRGLVTLLRTMTAAVGLKVEVEEEEKDEAVIRRVTIVERGGGSKGPKGSAPETDEKSTGEVA